jgi:hypothetical protein
VAKTGQKFRNLDMPPVADQPPRQSLPNGAAMYQIHSKVVLPCSTLAVRLAALGTVIWAQGAVDLPLKVGLGIVVMAALALYL